MGLLDEAIREHLELRRKHGADPSTVAREEHDALGSVERGDGIGSAAPGFDAGDQTFPRGETHVEDLEQPPETLHAGPETVEIDMREIFETDGPCGERDWPAAEQAVATSAAAARADHDRTSWMTDGDEDLAAWDLPVRARRLERVPGRVSSLGGEMSAEGSLS